MAQPRTASTASRRMASVMDVSSRAAMTGRGSCRTSRAAASRSAAAARAFSSCSRSRSFCACAQPSNQPGAAAANCTRARLHACTHTCKPEQQQKAHGVHLPQGLARGPCRATCMAMGIKAPTRALASSDSFACCALRSRACIGNRTWPRSIRRAHLAHPGKTMPSRHSHLSRAACMRLGHTHGPTTVHRRHGVADC